ncbi:uncharacterized protein TNCV_2233151 [Trichonephila clavipes]|nr:uncharacterized protein TNCV_2233151 [Trichonephila clavipes]
MPPKGKSGLSKNSSRACAAKIARNQESSVHAELRRQQQAQRRSILRAAETPLQYDASIGYHNHPLIVIGSMNKKFQYCDAFKWNDEITGMCCSSGKVSLPFLGEPEEP